MPGPPCPTSWQATETAAHLVTEFAGRARAFVQVQQGCDHRCTFCVIPFGRGRNRSVPIGAIVEQVRALVARGYFEVVLTGVDIASYGPDLPGAPTLGQMVRRLLALVPDLPRLRLSSSIRRRSMPTCGAFLRASRGCCRICIFRCRRGRI